MLTLFIMIVITFMLIGAPTAVIDGVVHLAPSPVEVFLLKAIPFALLIGLVSFAWKQGGVGG